MRHLYLVLAVLMLAFGAVPSVHAQRDSDSERRALQAYRDSLETEVMQKFVGKLSRDLKLNASQRGTVMRVLMEGSERRREIRSASSTLYSRLYRAVRDDDTEAAEFQTLLASHEALRKREHDLWEREQTELSAVLDPRQRAYFLLSWTRFQDTLREVMSRRPGGRDRDDDHPHEHSERDR